MVLVKKEYVIIFYNGYPAAHSTVTYKHRDSLVKIIVGQAIHYIYNYTYKSLKLVDISIVCLIKICTAFILYRSHEYIYKDARIQYARKSQNHVNVSIVNIRT